MDEGMSISLDGWAFSLELAEYYYTGSIIGTRAKMAGDALDEKGYATHIILLKCQNILWRNEQKRI